MRRKYLPFFAFQIGANLLWAYWALPEMNEEGSAAQSLEWLAAQILFPALFCVLLTRKKKTVLWMLVMYGGWLTLYGLGTTGWALMGPGTPFSVYAVCVLFLIAGFGIIYHALKDLNIGQIKRNYGLED
jgi:hypothetical protein